MRIKGISFKIGSPKKIKHSQINMWLGNKLLVLCPFMLKKYFYNEESFEYCIELGIIRVKGFFVGYIGEQENEK